MKEKLSHDKHKDLQVFKDEIRRLLKEEIVGRYYYQEGSIEASLSGDEQVIRAAEVLGDHDQYSSILKTSSPEVIARSYK